MCLLERRKLLSRNNATYIHKLRKFLEKTYKSLAKVFKVTDYHIGIEMAQAVLCLGLECGCHDNRLVVFFRTFQDSD